MDYATLLVLAAGLSVDSFAVSLGCGFSKQGICIKRTLGLALSLALFQALAPVLGWMMGTGVKNYVAQVDHWIAFGLLAIIGGKMILESTKKKEGCACSLSLKETLWMSTGTSIDALVVGFSFAFLDVKIIRASVIIGVTTFVFALTGLLLGKSAGKKLGAKVEIFGGIVLIGIGLKILIEHMIEHGM